MRDNRITQTIVEVTSLGRVAWALLLDDPTHLITQAARRLPSPIRSALARITPPACLPATLRAAVFTMADRRHEAQSVLRCAPNSRIANELRVLHGLALPESATATQRARQFWEAGDLHGALAIAPAGALRTTLESYERILRPGSCLGVPHVVQGRTPRLAGEPLRVMFQLTNSLPWTQSGYTLRSHQTLAALRGAGVEAEAVTRIGYPLDIGVVGSSNKDFLDGVTYRRFKPRRIPRSLDARYAMQAEELAEQAARLGADVIHSTTPYTNGLIAEAAARALGIPWVYEARGEMESTWLASRPDWVKESASRSFRYDAMRRKETELAIRADRVVVLSGVQRDGLVARGVPAEKITVVRNAVDPDSLARHLSKKEARIRLGLDPQTWLVGTVSAIVDYEGLDTLVRAVGHLRDDGVRVNAAIVGDGVALPDLRDLARKLGLEDRIVFPGRVSPDRARTWYQALDVMTIPRRDSEVTRAVTPMKGLQAMSYGIPQIVSDLPALVEISAAEGQGIAVEPESSWALAAAIAHLRSNSEAYSKHAKSAAQASGSHTWARRADQLCVMYSELVAPAPKKEKSE